MGSRPTVGVGNGRPSVGNGRPSAPRASQASAGGRAFGLDPRWTVVLVVVVLAALALVGAALGGVFAAGSHARATASSTARYGGLPSWLPKPKHLVNQVLGASAAHPALAIQGNSVDVQFPQGHVLATAVGPETPEQGKFPVPATSPCTFIVTFARATAQIALNPSSFTLVDERGHVRHPRVSAMDGGPAPRTVQPGHTVSLRVYDVIPTGDGGLEWTPSGRRALVAWDFNVEID